MKKLNVINLSEKSYYYENEWIAPKYKIVGNEEYFQNSAGGELKFLNGKFEQILSSFFVLAQKLAKNRENPTYFIFDNTTDIILKRGIINRFIYNYSYFLYIEAETNEIFGRVWSEEKQQWIVEKIGEYKEKYFLELT
jgi:hypothetical protein